jgi:hypothetical protein
MVGGGQRSGRGGTQLIKVKVVNWEDLWSSKEGKKVTKNLEKILDNISNLSKCCDKLSKSFESLGKTLSVSSRGGTGGGGERRRRQVSLEETIKDLGGKGTGGVGGLVEALLGKIGGKEWENLGEGLKEKLSEVLEEVGEEELWQKLFGRIGGKEWKDLEKDVRGELSKILEEVDDKGLAEKLVGVIGDKSWRSLKDMEKELRDMLEAEEKVSLSSLIPKGSFLNPFTWSVLGGLIGSVLGGLLSQVEKIKDEIGVDIWAGRELAGTMELAAEMVSKTFSAASSAFQQTTYYLAQFGIGVGEAIGQVQELFAALGEGVKDFLSSGEAQKMLGYFTLLGVSAETTGGLAQQFRFLRGSVKAASKDFQSSAKMFLAAAKKMGVSVQQLVELQSRLLEGMYDIILAYRLTTQMAGLFGDQLVDNAKRFSVLGAALRQQGIAGAEEVSAALMNLSVAANLGWEQIGKMGITLGVMGKEAEVSTLFISKMIGEIFGLQDVFKDTQSGISGVVKKFKEMDETSRMLAIALIPSLAPLFAVDEEVLKRLDKVSKEIETIQSQIRIVDSTLAAIRDKAKVILSSFFAMKGVNKIISNFSKAIDRAITRVVEFLEKHEWLTKVLVTLTSLSMILGTVLLELAPALLVLIPVFVVIYSLGSKVLNGLASLFTQLGETAVKVGNFIFDAFKLPFVLISGLFKKLVSFGKTLFGIFMFLRSIGVDLGAVFSSLKGAITGLFSSLTGLSGVLVGVGGMLVSLSVMIVGMAGSFLVLGGIIVWISTIIASWFVAFSAFAGLVYGVVGVVRYLAENFDSIKRTFGKLIGASNIFVQNLKEAWEVLKGILMGEKSLGDLFDVFKKLFSKESLSSLWEAFKGMFSSKEFQDLVANLLNVFVKSFVEGFKLVWEFIYKFVTGGGLKKIYEAVKNVLSSALQGVSGDFLANFLSQFGKVVASIADLLTTIIVDIAKVLPALIFGFLHTIVNEILPTVFKVAIRLLNELPPLLVKIAMSVIAVLPHLLSVLEKYLLKLMKAAARAVANLLSSLINTLIARLPELMAALADLIVDLFSFLVESLGYVIESFFKLLSEIDWLNLLYKILIGLGVFIVRMILKIIANGLPAILKFLFRILIGLFRFLLVNLLTALLAPLKPLLSIFGVDVGKIISGVNVGAERLIDNFDNIMDSFSKSFNDLIDSLFQNTKATEKNTSALLGQDGQGGGAPQRGSNVTKENDVLVKISNATVKTDAVNWGATGKLQQQLQRLQEINKRTTELAPIWLSFSDNKIENNGGLRGTVVIGSNLAGKSVLIGQNGNDWGAHLVDIGNKQVDTLSLVASHLAEIKELLKRNAGQGQEVVINISSLGTNGYKTRA